MYVTIKKVSSVMNEMEVELTYNEITQVHEEYKVQLKKFGKYTSEIWKEVLEEIITETLQKRPQLV
jgi:DNA-directed RNA polymerase subunit F